MNNNKDMKKGDTFYYTKIIPELGVYELHELIIRTVEETYFVGTDTKDKRAYLLSYEDIMETVFVNRKDALDKIKTAEKHKPKVSDETYYEEY